MASTSYDLPGVGANLQDDLAVMISYRRKSRASQRMRFDRPAMAMLLAHFFGRGHATVLPGGLWAMSVAPGIGGADIQFIFRGLPAHAHLVSFENRSKTDSAYVRSAAPRKPRPS